MFLSLVPGFSQYFLRLAYSSYTFVISTPAAFMSSASFIRFKMSAIRTQPTSQPLCPLVTTPIWLYHQEKKKKPDGIISSPCAHIPRYSHFSYAWSSCSQVPRQYRFFRRHAFNSIKRSVHTSFSHGGTNLAARSSGVMILCPELDIVAGPPETTQRARAEHQRQE